MENEAKQETTRRLLEKAYQDFHGKHHRDRDPVGVVHTYQDSADQEIIAFLAALLSYGNVNSILNSVRKVVEPLGSAPRHFLLNEEIPEARFRTFKHRFTTGDDIVILLHWMQSLLKASGSLENAFGHKSEVPLEERLSDFVQKLRSQSLPKRLRPVAKTRERQLKYLVSDPRDGSACKRLNMFLRWVVRGPDGVDLGLWKTVSPSHLVLPLDTHLLKALRYLGWVKGTSANWKAAVTATAKLRQLFPEDPLRYDFALCHLGINRSSLKAYSR